METTYRFTIARSKPKQARWPWIVAIVWIGATMVGMWLLWRHASIPGTPAQAPENWPSGSAIDRNPQGDTLVMFVHPQCPCTRASMGELEKIVARGQGKLTPWIVVYKPSHSEAKWEQTDLWRSAVALPGAHVIVDPDGAEAHRFHAYTSGQTLLYDAAGHLLFSGGITESRGHAGDNAGGSAIVDLLTTGAAGCRETPVFGCPILPTPNAH